MHQQDTTAEPSPATQAAPETLRLSPAVAQATLTTLNELSVLSGLSSEQAALRVVCHAVLNLPPRGCTYAVHRILSSWGLSHLVSPLLTPGKKGGAQSLVFALGFSSDTERLTWVGERLGGRTISSFKELTAWEGAYLRSLHERGVNA